MDKTIILIIIKLKKILQYETKNEVSYTGTNYRHQFGELEGNVEHLVSGGNHMISLLIT
jgi:hypothetical protein